MNVNELPNCCPEVKDDPALPIMEALYQGKTVQLNKPARERRRGT